MVGAGLGFVFNPHNLVVLYCWMVLSYLLNVKHNKIMRGVLNFSQQWLLPLQDSGREPRQYPAIYQGQSIRNIITAKITGSRQIEPLPEKN